MIHKCYNTDNRLHGLLLLQLRKLCVCVCVWYFPVRNTQRYVMVHAWRSKDDFRCRSLLSTLFETGSFVVQRHVYHVIWPTSFQGFSCLSLPSYCGSIGITDVCVYMALWRFWGFALSSSCSCGNHVIHQVSLSPFAVCNKDYRLCFWTPRRLGSQVQDSSNFTYTTLDLGECLSSWVSL